MKSPKISIVLTAYQAQDYICICIDSILQQTRNDYELIIVDDGSTDDTSVICESYCKYQQIKYIRTMHMGVSYARNIGMQNCTGSHVTFIDYDDFIELNLLEEYYQVLSVLGEDTNALVLVGMEVIDNTYNPTRKIVNYFPYQKELIEIEPKDIGVLVWKKLFNFCTNKLYSLEWIRKHGLEYKTEIHIAEDLQFNIDYLRTLDSKLFLINKPLYHYVRRNNDSLALSHYEEGIKHTKEVYKNLLDYAYQIGVNREGILVIKATFLVDWTSRLTACYEIRDENAAHKENKKIVHNEISGAEFQALLQEVHKAKKVSNLRYHVLRTKNFFVYIRLRNIYRVLIKNKGN